MKRIYYIYALLIGMLGFTACSDDGFGHNGEVEAGLPTTVKINFSTPEAENVVTKSASVSDFSKVQSIYIFIFDQDGNLDGSANPDASTTSSISIPTTTGPHTIYGVANYYGTELGNVSAQLAAVKSISDLTAITDELNNEKLEVVSSTMMMSGFYAADAAAAKAGTIGTANFTVNDPNTYTIYLDRFFSGINFNVSCGTTGSTFTLSSYQIMNVPKTSTLVGPASKIPMGSNTAPTTFNTASSRAFTTNEAKVSTFSFYMLENAAGIVSAATSLKARESRTNQGTSQVQGDWVNAPATATYIILKGKYTGAETVNGATQNVSADVTYYIHLGDNKSGTVFTDYNSYRNKNYTYKVTVYGVNNIIVETTATGPEYGPGDGTVTFGGKLFEVDAHYSSFNITLNGGETYTYDWDKTLYGTTPWVYLAPGSNLTYSTSNIASKLLTSQDALNTYLSTKSGSITFTAFVNENYPMSGNAWTNYVNTDNRTFKILPSTAAAYKNGSAVVNDGVLISQEPIMTFFSNGGYAYGVEWINESYAVNYGTTYDNGASSDGRANMLTEINGKNWANVYNKSYNKAYIACMQRNRDEDHDGVIDGAEVKWFLPSLSQISGLWSGSSILGGAWLYSGDTKDLSTISDAKRDSTYHFWTNSGYYNKKYIWSEEGSSFGDDSPSRSFQIRCVRYLGQTTAPATTYYNYANNVFDLSPMFSGAIRSSVSSELIKHNEQDASNKLSAKFQVATRDVYSYAYSYTNKNAPTLYTTGTFNWKTYNDLINSDPSQSPCYNYAEEITSWNVTTDLPYIFTIKSATDLHKWRLPNQRELALMIEKGLLTGSHVSRTYFSNQNYRLGYAFNSSELYLISPNENPAYYVRCVRDL